MEGKRSLFTPLYGNSRRQNGIQTAQKLFAVPFVFRFKIAAKLVCVNTGIGAAAGDGLCIFSEQTEKVLSQFALNRNRPGLKLPAMEKRAVIGKGQLDIPHILNQPSEVSVENNHAGKCRGENKETCKIRKAIFHLLHPCSSITAVVTTAGHCK